MQIQKVNKTHKDTSKVSAFGTWYEFRNCSSSFMITFWYLNIKHKTWYELWNCSSSFMITFWYLETVSHQDDSAQTSGSVGSNNLFEQFDTAGEEHQQGFDVVTKRTAKAECCSCSKKSLCKTTKCKCRSTGRSCGSLCGCALGKCSNRSNRDEKPGEMINAFGPPMKPLSDIKNVLVSYSFLSLYFAHTFLVW